MTGQWGPGRVSHVAPVIITSTFQLGKISPEHGLTSQSQLRVNKPEKHCARCRYVVSILSIWVSKFFYLKLHSPFISIQKVLLHIVVCNHFACVHFFPSALSNSPIAWCKSALSPRPGCHPHLSLSWIPACTNISQLLQDFSQAPPACLYLVAGTQASSPWVPRQNKSNNATLRPRFRMGPVTCLLVILWLLRDLK